MKWMSIYLLGYVLFMGGVFLALWQWGVLENMGPVWTMVVVLIALGMGVMVAVANSGRKENIQISSK
jgi:hypothetical protein